MSTIQIRRTHIFLFIFLDCVLLRSDPESQSTTRISHPRHLPRRWEAFLIPCSHRSGAIYRTLNEHINHF